VTQKRYYIFRERDDGEAEYLEYTPYGKIDSEKMRWVQTSDSATKFSEEEVREILPKVKEVFPEKQINFT
jgi:hypothetical protein